MVKDDRRPYKLDAEDGFFRAVLVAFLSLFVFTLSFHHHLFDENHVLIDLGFDGFKNYYTFGYHLRHGGGHWFHGMAFPFGDNIIFADAQPAISSFLNWISVLFPWLKDHTSLVINSLMALGFSLGTVFIYKILREAELNILLSLSLALGLTYLSPQLFRMTHHHALSYVFIIPSVFYFHSRISQFTNFKNIILFSFYLCLVPFIHAYYLLMIGIYYSGFFVADLFYTRKIKYWHYIPFLISLFVFWAFLGLSDPFTDRPRSPWGLFHFTSSITDLFLPYTGILNQFLRNNLKWYTTSGYSEGAGYIGIYGLIALISTIIGLIFRIVPKYNRITIKHFSGALLCLLFATQWPLINLEEDLVRSIPILGQFRGSGRFIWPVFYSLTIFSSIYLYHLIKSKVGSHALQNAIWAALILLVLFESSQHLIDRSRGLIEYSGPDVLNQNKSISNWLSHNSIDPEDIRALITIPHSTIGSEKLDLYDNYHVKMLAWPFSYQVGTPMTAINLSRTPLQTMCYTLSLIENECIDIDKKILLPSGQYLIVILNKLIPDYSYLLDESELLGQNSHASVYLINYDALVTRKFDECNWTQKYSCSSSDSTIIFCESFDTSDGTPGVYGSSIKPQGKTQEFIINLNQCAGESITINVWNQLSPHAGGIIQWNVRFLEDQRVLEDLHLREHDVESYEVMGTWVNYSMKYTIPDLADKIVLSLQGENLQIDELMIRCMK